MKFSIEVDSSDKDRNRSSKPSYKSLVSALRVIHYLSLSDSEESRKMTEFLCRTALRDSSKII